MGAVSVYLDVNVIVPLFAIDPLNERAEKALRGLHNDLIVSNFSRGGVFRRDRAPRADARSARRRSADGVSNFDTWCARHTRLVEIDGSDIAGATGLMRRLDLSLRTPDALHIAMVQRAGCKLLTFDRTMATAAHAGA